MAAANTPLRVVLDTNVLISALLFRNGRLSALRTAWRAAQFVPAASRATLDELSRILAYKKLNLNDAQQAAALALYVPYIEAHQVNAQAVVDADLPACLDPKDQILLDLAQSASVDYLVRGDEDLLGLDEALGKHGSFRIVQPQVFLEILAPA